MIFIAILLISLYKYCRKTILYVNKAKTMNNFQNIFKPDTKYKPFFLSMLIFGIACGLYKGILDNYLAEIVAMTEFDKGVSEFFRELPGLMFIFILAALYMFSAEKIYKIGAVIMLIGMCMHAVVPPSLVLVIFAMFVFSLGEHMLIGMRNTLCLEYAKKDHGGEALGLQNSTYQIGNLAGFAVIIVVFSIFASSGQLFSAVFWGTAVVMLLGVVSSLQMTGHSSTDETKRRFYFRKKYNKFYILEVFYGARKQIFLTFGPYVLVLFYNANAMVMSLLFAISAVCCFFASPVVGKIIDRIGYKTVMIADTLILVIVCFFYGFAHHIFPMHIALIICCVNYVLDSVISLASMATAVYVQDLSENTDEVRATLSTGLSVNHLISVLIALFGGWVWKVLGIETLFVLSALLGLANSAYAATIKVKK